MTTSPRRDRERIRRTLTFWLRPAFLLRTLNRFQRVVGFDRAIALASGALTAFLWIIGALIDPTPNAAARMV